MYQFLETTSTGSMLSLVLPMLVLVVFMYLIIYLPQKKQDKKWKIIVSPVNGVIFEPDTIEVAVDVE